MKVCNKCNEEKPLIDFGVHPLGKFGLRPNCKECHNKSNRALYQRIKSLRNEQTNKYHYRRKYNLSVDEVRFGKEQQNYTCLICETKTELQCDHNHENGKVRGYLCHRCNKALGLLKDNVSNLERAIMYLRNNS